MMRIYFINPDLDENVKEYRDDDVICSPIDVGVVLMSVWERQKPGSQKVVIKPTDSDYWLAFAEAGKENYIFLWNLGMDLIDEHYHRFGKRIHHSYKHGMWRLMERMESVPPLPDLPLGEIDYGLQLNQYSMDKSRPNKWTGRSIPSWATK
jgi:hypothetical protein